MRNYTKLYFLFLAFTSFYFLSSCDTLGDFEDPVDTQREFAIPLFTTTTSVSDLLGGLSEETYVTMGPDDLITLNYKGDVAQRTGEELFDFIQDIGFPLTDSVSRQPFDIEGEVDLTLIKLKGGILTTVLTNPFEDFIDVVLTIPQLTKNGVPFEKTKTLDPASFNSLPWTTISDMEDRQITSTNDSIAFIYEAYRQSNGERVELEGFAAVQNFQFSYIEGFWGTDTLDLIRDTIEIEFFERWSQGDVFFERPRIEVDVLNSFGFPVKSIINTMEILTVNNESIPLESPFVTDGIDFAYPLLNEVGEVKTTTFYFDKDNSNVDEILSKGPLFLDYDVDALANPNGFTELGFMTDQSTFRVQLQVELPFHARINNFKADDQFDVDFSGFEDVDYVEFKMITENEIPLGIDVQLYFADENEVVIDSLFTNYENILDAAPVDQYGDVNGRSDKTTFMTIDAEKFKKVKDAKKLLIAASFFTSDATNGTMVNLRDNENVNIRMGMKVGTK